MGILDVIDRGLSESQQNIINLTEPDYDVYPLPVSMDTTVKVAIDIEIQSQAMAGFILGHPKYGILGSSKLGTAASDWVTEQEYVNI
jgi:hypothetical protein